MGRHDSGDTTGPFKRIKYEPETIPSAEVTKRRAWPVALILTAVLVFAVAVPVGLRNLSAEENPTPSRSAVSDQYSAEPSPSADSILGPEPADVRPTATITKNRIEYKLTPGPTTTKTITVTSPAKTITAPGPAVTVRVTLTPKPVPIMTSTEIVYQDRCFRVRNGIITEELECP